MSKDKKNNKYSGSSFKDFLKEELNKDKELKELYDEEARLRKIDNSILK